MHSIYMLNQVQNYLHYYLVLEKCRNMDHGLPEEIMEGEDVERQNNWSER